MTTDFSGNSALFDICTAPAKAMKYLQEFDEAVQSKGFPCIFAPLAFRHNDLLFGLADISAGYQQIILLFNAAVQSIMKNSNQTIVLWIEGTDTNNLEEDKNIASAILKELLTADQTPWPASAPTNPNDPNWDFWYGGVDCFINFSTPHHVKRRSRNLGSAFTLVIQSRSTFDHIGKNPMQIRHRIRERIAQYDTIPMSPALGEHGNAPELPQFFLGDDNIEAAMLLTEQDILRRSK